MLTRCTTLTPTPDPILFGTNFDERVEGDRDILETYERRDGSPYESWTYGYLDASSGHRAHPARVQILSPAWATLYPSARVWHGARSCRQSTVVLRPVCDLGAVVFL